MLCISLDYFSGHYFPCVDPQEFNEISHVRYAINKKISLAKRIFLFFFLFVLHDSKVLNIIFVSLLSLYSLFVFLRHAISVIFQQSVMSSSPSLLWCQQSFVIFLSDSFMTIVVIISQHLILWQLFFSSCFLHLFMFLLYNSIVLCNFFGGELYVNC